MTGNLGRKQAQALQPVLRCEKTTSTTPKKKLLLVSHDVTKFQTIHTKYPYKCSLRIGSWFSDRPRLNCVTWHLHDGRESCDFGLKGDLFRGIRLFEQFLY